MTQVSPIGKEYRLLSKVRLLLLLEEKCLIYGAILCRRPGLFGIEEET